jgi:hypothetical protein
MERWSREVQATMLHAIFLSRNLDDNSNCKARMISFSNGKTIRGQAAQGLYEITLREVAKVNELTGMITLARGCRPGSLNPMDSPEGTVVWEYDSMACPQMIVQLYKVLRKVYTNQTKIFKDSMAVVKHKDKDQAAGL